MEDYLKKINPNKNIFLDGLIYKDYDVLNHLLVKKFNLDVEYIEKALMKYNCKIKEEKLKYNINCLKNNISGKTYYLNINSFSKFLKEIGMKADEAFLKRLFLDDASIGTTGGVLLMGAMVKTGRKTSFTMPDGSERHILWKSRIVGAEEACSVVASTGTDITEKVMLAAQLEDIRHNHAAVNEGLKVAAESADFGILTIRHSSHGYYIDITPNGLSMLRMQEADFAEFIDRLVPEDRDIFSDTMIANQM